MVLTLGGRFLGGAKIADMPAIVAELEAGGVVVAELRDLPTSAPRLKRALRKRMRARLEADSSWAETDDQLAYATLALVQDLSARDRAKQLARGERNTYDLGRATAVALAQSLMADLDRFDDHPLVRALTVMADDGTSAMTPADEEVLREAAALLGIAATDLTVIQQRLAVRRQEALSQLPREEFEVVQVLFGLYHVAGDGSHVVRGTPPFSLTFAERCTSVERLPLRGARLDDRPAQRCLDRLARRMLQAPPSSGWGESSAIVEGEDVRLVAVDKPDEIRTEPLGEVLHDIDRTGEMQAVPPRSGAGRGKKRKARNVFLAVRMARPTETDLLEETLTAAGATVTRPDQIVFEHQREPQPVIRRAVMDAIEAADVMIVNLRQYGLDCAWKLGYADAMDVPVIGWSDGGRAASEERIVKRHLYDDCPMHGWDELPRVAEAAAALDHLPGGDVLVAVPFRDEQFAEQLQAPEVRERLVFPKDRLGKIDLTYEGRRLAIDLQKRCSSLLVGLPRYGMDVAWQLGYATGKDQAVVGLLGEDTGPPEASASAWEHWMHGWVSRTVVTDLSMVAALVAADEVWS